MTSEQPERDPAVVRTAVIVEDDPELRDIIATVCESAGFSTVSVDNGVDAVRAVLHYQPSIVTMDVRLPGIDGIEAIRRIRAESDTRIIIVSGLSEEADVLVGYSAGADGYLRKPLLPRELRAMVERLMARIQTGDTTRASEHRSVVATKVVSAQPEIATEWNGIVVDLGTRVASVNGDQLSLTVTEFAILEALVRNAPNVLTFDTLSRAIDAWGGGGERESIRYRTHIANLRRKLGDRAGAPRWIATVRSVGYRLVGAPLIRDSDPSKVVREHG